MTHAGDIQICDRRLGTGERSSGDHARHHPGAARADGAIEPRVRSALASGAGVPRSLPDGARE
jgi:hypothetical protein